MHYPMYTFSENVQLSAADLDLASLGTQACEEREREREREGGGGGLKGSAHFALQILVIGDCEEAQREVVTLTTLTDHWLR